MSALRSDRADRVDVERLTAEDFDAVLVALDTFDRPASCRDIRIVAGMRQARANAVLYELQRQGAVQRGYGTGPHSWGSGRWSRVEGAAVAVNEIAIAPELPLPAGRRLPTFAPGKGERRSECVRYGACLSEWCTATARLHRDPEGHCPQDCSLYEAIDKRPRVEHEAASRPGGVVW
jgi:hypothetical protein